MKKTFKEKILFAFGAFALSMLAACAIIAFQFMRGWTSSGDWVRHTYQVSTEIEQINTVLTNAEFSCRGYILTGDESLFERYNSLLPAVKSEEKELRELTKDNPVQQRNLDILEPLLIREQAWQKEAMALLKSGGYAAAGRKPPYLNAKEFIDDVHRMDDVRSALHQMGLEEKTLLARRLSTYQATTSKTVGATVAGFSLGFTFLFIIIYVLSKEIVQRQRAEAEARESGKRYRMLFDTIDEGFCIVEMIFDEHERPVDYRFLEINPSFEKQTGLVGAQGKSMRELAPQHEEHWFEIYGKIALTGEPARFQNLAEQLHRWYDVYAFRFGKPENRQVAILFNDITERRRTEEALRESEEKFRLLVDSAQDYAIVMLGTNGRVASWNEGAQRMKGYTASEIIGKHFSCFYPEDDIKNGKPEYELKIASETGRFEDEGLRVRKDGSHFQANVVINAIRDKSGKLRGFSKITRDITERKRAEELLRASVRLGEYTLNHSLDGLLTYILDEAESLTGSRIGFFHFLEPDQKTLRLQTWSTNTLKNMCTAEGKGAHYSVDEAGVWVEAIKERRPAVHNDYNSLPGRKGLPAGHSPVIREMVVPIFRGGEITAVIGVGNKPEDYLEQDLKTVTQLANRAWDIILAKRADDEIKKLNEDLEKRVVVRTTELTAVNDELEAFTYSVSHDLRAPLRHIHGFVDLLVQTSGQNLDDKGKRYLATISKAASQMGNLVDDLLTFSRMGRTEIKKHSIDLKNMVQGVIDEMKYELRERDIEWKVGSLAPVYGDPSLLRLVMVNLISNAAKFTRQRDKAVIEIGSYTEAGGHDVVYVKDNGVGFDMRYVDKLFGVFQRLHSIEEFEGTGIGLANIRRIISRHGGRTWAEGTIGTGAAFYFSLPSKDGDNV